ncbi:hypothetical protein V8E55_007802 [Tylopilus felleus]
MPDSQTWLVTGASRGIGLSIVLRLLPNSPETSGKLHVVQMDITDKVSVSRTTREVENILGSAGLDYLVNNAGIAVKDDTPATLYPKDLAVTIMANVVGHALVTRAFTPLIKRGNHKVIVNISSTLASIGTDYAACIVVQAYKQAKERPDLNLNPFLVDPGWVKTDMGGDNATLEPHESAAGIVNVISNVNQSYAGCFLNYKGETVPW